MEAIRQKMVQKIGENISVRRFERIETDAKLETYIHPPGKIGVMVDYTGSNPAVAKDVAMHIAFAKPKFMSRDQVAPMKIPSISKASTAMTGVAAA